MWQSLQGSENVTKRRPCPPARSRTGFWLSAAPSAQCDRLAVQPSLFFGNWNFCSEVD